jgi:hypothetical protein
MRRIFAAGTAALAGGIITACIWGATGHAATVAHITRRNITIGTAKHAQHWACHDPKVNRFGTLSGTHCIPVISPASIPGPSPTPVSYPSTDFVLCYPNYSVWIYGGMFKSLTNGYYELRNGTPPPWTEELSGYNQGVC